MEGYVKLFRSIEKWEWYTDSDTKCLFLHCLIRANHHPRKWHGITIEAGSFVTSYEHLSSEMGISVRSLRTSMNKLKSTGELTSHSTNRFTVISVAKWRDYQSQDDDNDTPIANQNVTQETSDRQTTDKQPTTNKNDKNYKNEKNKNNTKEDVDVSIDSLKKQIYGEFGNIKLSGDEYTKIKSQGLEKYIATLDSYKASTGKRYKSDYATILNWFRKDNSSKRTEPIPDYSDSTPKMSAEEIKELELRLKRMGKKP
jgi:hypothetical protein